MPARSFDMAGPIVGEATPCTETTTEEVALPHEEVLIKDMENVVIGGISCRLPQSDNMQEFRDNLMNGIDMVTEDDHRWPPGKYFIIQLF